MSHDPIQHPHDPRITIDPNVMVGRPCIRGLRFPVSRLLGMLAAGQSEAEILKNHPDLEAADIRAAISYAAALADQRVVLSGVRMSSKSKNKPINLNKRGPRYNGTILVAIRERMEQWNLKPAHVAKQLRQFNHTVIYRFLAGENTRTEVAEAVMSLLCIELQLPARNPPSWIPATTQE
jgi:uncharacterized protein (DUF433 family)